MLFELALGTGFWIALVALATPLWLIAIELGRGVRELRRMNDREDYRLRSQLTSHNPNTRLPPA